MYKGLNWDKENDTYWDNHKSNSICSFNMKFCSKLCAMAVESGNIWTCGLSQSKYTKEVFCV